MSEHQCSECGAQGMVHETRDLKYEYKGDRLIVPAMTGWFCNSCSEAELDEGFGEAYFAQIQEFTLKRDAEEGQWLSDTVKKLGLSNAEAVAIAGGGKNAFARYRAGVKPVAAVKTIFELLGHHPELVPEVLEMNHVKAGLPKAGKPKTGKYSVADVRRLQAALQKVEPSEPFYLSPSKKAEPLKPAYLMSKKVRTGKTA